MITVKEMIEELKKYPMDAMCYAYEGEMQGLVIVSNNTYNGEQLGTIDAEEEWIE